MTPNPTIPEFFANKTIFLTGGSGFLGKLLIEKLLRSCPDINCIYVLMRGKKGKSVEERIRTIIDLPLFDLVRSQHPESLEKIKVITGDLTQLGLGISPEDRKLLIDHVNIVYHSGASVRFDDSLTDAVFVNVRGTREVANLALQMQKLDVLIHVSTTYCQIDKKVVEETLYPNYAEWRKTIQIAESADRDVLNALTDKYIHPFPNTYVFTKSLGEQVVNDLCNGKIPVVMLRPSIVTCTYFEPMPGWVDNLNGPMSIVTGCGMGLIHVTYGKADVMADFIPGDILSKAFIISAWKQANFKKEEERLALNVYNCSNNNYIPVSLGECSATGIRITQEAPFNSMLWYPSIRYTACYYEYFFKTILYQVLLAIFIDGLLKIRGRKPMLLKLQRRIYTSTMNLCDFTLNDWKFINTKFLDLERNLHPEDIENFNFRKEEINIEDFSRIGRSGIKRYLLKEDGDEKKAQKRAKRMQLLANTVKFLWYVGLFWFLFVKINVLGMILNIIMKCTGLDAYSGLKSAAIKNK